MDHDCKQSCRQFNRRLGEMHSGVEFFAAVPQMPTGPDWNGG